ncbi:MAG TPA: iron ABC transporter permease [Chloroflexota bacterium]|nr:iron ABC transporter permease [Chloroflexota bacterium]
MATVPAGAVRPVTLGLGRLQAALGRNAMACVVLAVVGLVVGAPIAAALVMSLHPGLAGNLGGTTAANFVTAYTDVALPGVIWNTVLFAAGTTLVTLVFAVPLVWLVNRTDMPGKELVLSLTIASLLVPVFLGAMGWMLLLSPEIGLANLAAKAVFGLSKPPFSIYNIGGMAWVQGLSLVPGSFFMLSAAVAAMDPAMEEASHTSGVGRLRTLLRINVPLAWPALAAVMVYVFMLAVSLFETPAIIGWPARIFTLSSLIYFAVAPQTGLPSYGLAGAYAVMMIVLGLVLALCYFRIIRHGRKYAVITGRGYRPRLTKLGRWKTPALGFVALYGVVALLVPVVCLLWVSILPRIEVPSREAFAHLTLANYTDIPQYVGLQPFVNTALLIVTAPTLAIVLSLAVSWVVIRQRFALRGALDSLAFLPHAVPHIVFAAALAFLALVYRRFIPIYGSLTIIIVAHAIAYLAYGSRTLNSAMIQIHRELEESGRVCGSSATRVLRRILVPLIATAVFNAWLFIALLSYREVTMALLLRSSTNTVLSVLVWNLWNTGKTSEVGALGVLLMAVSLTLAWLARGTFVRLLGSSES